MSNIHFRVFRLSQIKLLILRLYEKLKWKYFLTTNCPSLWRLERGSWSMDSQDFKYIYKRLKSISNRKELTLLELGAGVSTLIFLSKISKLSSQALIISFEAEKEWIEIVQNLIDKYKLNKKMLKLYHVEYKDYGKYKWFNQQAIEMILERDLCQRKIDVLIIDAPPKILCPYSRKPAIPFLLKYLKNESLLFLHDAKRDDESYIINEWRKYFEKMEVINTPLGLAIFWNKK